jgi:hypothetical protein
MHIKELKGGAHAKVAVMGCFRCFLEACGASLTATDQEPEQTLYPEKRWRQKAAGLSPGI